MTHSLVGLSVFAWARQRDALAFSYPATYPRTFVASGNGAANGTTIVSTGLAAYTSADSEICGMFVQVVKAANASGGPLGSPIRARVTAYDDSTSTLTIEGLGFQTATGDTFSLLDPPNPWWCEHTGGSQTKVIDPARDEADDLWIGTAQQAGPYMVPRKASAVTAQKLITDFSTATGTATCENLLANTAVGDLFEAWQYPEISSGFPVEFKPIARVDRGALTGKFGMVRGSAGNATGSATTEHLDRGPGSTRAGLASELDTAYGAILDVADGVNYTASTGCSTSSVTVTAGTPAQGGGWISSTGDAFVATTSADPIVPYPTLRSVPNGATLTGLRKYTASDAVNYALTLLQWHGKESYDFMVGCVPSIKWSVERDNYLKTTLSWQIPDGVRRTISEDAAAFARALDPKRSTVTPRAIHDVRAVLGTTDLEVTKFEFDLGVDLQPKINLSAPGNTDGVELRNFMPSGSIYCHLDDDERAIMNDALYGKTYQLFVQINDVAGDPGVWALYCREIEITDVAISDDAGGYACQLSFRVTVDPTSDMPWFAIYRG